MSAIILDLDNTIADDGWRIQTINWDATNPDLRYATYHELASDDQLRNRHLFDGTKHDIVIMTARPLKYRASTIAWLRRNGVDFRWLLMRNPADHTPSAKLKEKMLGWLLNDYHYKKGDIVAAYDDRQDVVDMFLRNGISATRVCIHDKCAYTPPKKEQEVNSTDPTAFPTLTGTPVPSEQPAKRPKDAAMILDDMADTFRQRQKVYGSNYLMVAPLVKVLFPNGVPREVIESHKWHLFELKLVKLSRFAISNLTHLDSIHDDAVYAAMIEAIILDETKEQA